MALILNEEQEMLREAARAFLEERSPVSLFRALRDRNETWSPDLWHSIVEMGWTGMTIPETCGGLGFGHVGAGLVVEECGRTLATSPLSSSVVCAALIEHAASDDRKAALLTPIASGETIVTLALSESNRFDPDSISMSAHRDDGGYLLEGRKSHVIDAAMADALLVVAHEPGTQAPCLFLVPCDAAGLVIDETLNLDNRIVGTARFDAVRVDDNARLDAPGRARPALERALDIGAALSAAELSGIAQSVFACTVDYLKERRQFGVPIGAFQALQHRAAQLFSEIEICKSIVLKALQAIESDSADRSALVSAAKSKAAKTARLATSEGVQMFGGIGMTDEIDVGFFMKRAAAAIQEYGDDTWHADRFARLRGY